MKEKENQNIEWKSSWKDEYLKWICGYAHKYLELLKNDGQHHDQVGHDDK